MEKELGKIKEQEERWQYFIEELRAIYYETMRNSKIELLKAKWLLGKRIVEEEMNFERGVYGERTVQNLAPELDMSPSHLWKVIQFFKQFPKENFDEVLAELPGGQKDPTWYFITQKVLPKPKNEKEKEEERKEKQKNCSHQNLKCLDCGKKLTLQDLI